MHRHLFLLALLISLCSCANNSNEAKWYKGNLHTHSLWSDGNDFPEQICDWYRDHGYNFLAISDHNTLAEGEKWMKIAELRKRGSIPALNEYLLNYGSSGFVATRTRGDRNGNDF